MGDIHRWPLASSSITSRSNCWCLLFFYFRFITLPIFLDRVRVHISFAEGHGNISRLIRKSRVEPCLPVGATTISPRDLAEPPFIWLSARRTNQSGQCVTDASVRRNGHFRNDSRRQRQGGAEELPVASAATMVLSRPSDWNVLPSSHQDR